MIRKFRKYAVCMLLIILSIVSRGDTVLAEESGSITVHLQDTDAHTPVSGAEFTLYQVGNIRHEGNTLTYTYKKEFENNGMSLDDLRAEGLAQHLADYADGKISGTVKAGGEDGTVVWEHLELGLYLVVQTKRAEGYCMTEPFLVSVPMTDSETATWIYDVDASPKVKPSPENPEDTELTVKKVWVDNGKNTPAGIKVNLYRDNKEYDSCILNESNNWTKTWDKLSGEYNWTVKEAEVPAGYTVTYSSVGKEITITNTSGSEKPKNPPLIQTGQLNWPIPVLAGAGILIFTAGWVMTFMKRKK